MSDAVLGSAKLDHVGIAAESAELPLADLLGGEVSHVKRMPSGVAVGRLGPSWRLSSSCRRNGDSDRPVSRETWPRPSSHRLRWTNRSTGSSLDCAQRASTSWGRSSRPPTVGRPSSCTPRPQAAYSSSWSRENAQRDGLPARERASGRPDAVRVGPVLHPGPGRPRSGHRQDRASRERGRLSRAGPRLCERREREL